MKKILLALPIALSPALAAAQADRGASMLDDKVAFASAFAGNFSLLLSIIIGAIATYLVFRAASRLGGGLFGAVLNYVAVGMLLIVIGNISAISNPWISGFWLSILSTTFFAAGYIFMVLGGNKLFKGIMTN